ncbi:MAG: DUF721 domain-containing protein [Gammaproteobacteria bacterium]|nr:DUF721 domain-containing protein [Gammaproteobacteria bacterium]MDH3534920.1 DUF721 domain-containing protein [Gammaproteobacteria bacterium]
MGASRIDRLCQSLLPPGFEQLRRKLPEIQRFLEQNLPEPVNQSVTLLNLNRDEIVIAASTPMVANYLRLHAGEIQQQLRETFGFEQPVRFRTLPDSMLRLGTNVFIRKPRSVSKDAVAAIEAGAQWVDDKDLQAALQSLAQSLKTD